MGFEGYCLLGYGVLLCGILMAVLEELPASILEVGWQVLMISYLRRLTFINNTVKTSNHTWGLFFESNTSSFVLNATVQYAWSSHSTKENAYLYILICILVSQPDC